MSAALIDAAVAHGAKGLVSAGVGDGNMTTPALDAVKRAIDELSAANAAVGQHLAARVETGTVCCYHRRSPG